MPAIPSELVQNTAAVSRGPRPVTALAQAQAPRPDSAVESGPVPSRNQAWLSALLWTNLGIAVYYKQQRLNICLLHPEENLQISRSL